MRFLKYLLLLAIFSCQAQVDFHYRKIPVEYESFYKDPAIKRSEILKNLRTPFHMRSVLPANYDTSGRADYTPLFQEALIKNREVVFPSGKFFISKKGLTVPSNTKIYFEEDSELLFEKNDLRRYEILRIHDVENVEIYYANITGDRETHTGNTGEWGFGISIQDSKNIYLYKPIVKNCWGDGIFIGSEGKILSEDITVEGGLVDNNRRNGLSVTSVIGLQVSHFIAANSNGTFPKAGIDFEPSNNWEFMENADINNIVTFNNEEDGLLIVMAALKAQESKKVLIRINSHKDIYSKYGLGLMMENEKLPGKLPVGNILIQNLTYLNNKSGDIRNYSLRPNNNIKIIIDKLQSNNRNERIINSEIIPNNLTIINSAK